MWVEITGGVLIWVFGTIAVALWFACNKLEMQLTHEELRNDALTRDLIHAYRKLDVDGDELAEMIRKSEQ